MSQSSPQSFATPAAGGTGEKRSLNPSSPVDLTSSSNPRKAPKISRACDICKSKKAKCTGTIPCRRCVERNLVCVYDSEYLRGRRPPTPVLLRGPSLGRPPTPSSSTAIEHGQVVMAGTPQPSVPTTSTTARTGMMIPDTPEQTRNLDAASVAPAEPVTARGSPELGATEIDGQYIEPTSGLTFLHRAYKRLSTQRTGASNLHDSSNASESTTQPLMSTGDKPFPLHTTSVVSIPQDAAELLRFYFDVCVVTYRIFHRPSVEGWLQLATQDVAQGRPVSHTIGNAKAAILLTIFAITIRRKDRFPSSSYTSLHGEDSPPVQRSESYFSTANGLTQAETGLPRLESAQARLVQVLYLMQTSRMSLAWYFGMSIQIVSAMGLHRTPGRKRGQHHRADQADYVQLQCRRRTFWVAYIIDVYLSVVFGRPRYLNDDDIDQELPDSINDEDMNSNGPLPTRPDAQLDSHMDAVIGHAKLARIIADISREVYTIKPVAKRERLARARVWGQRLHSWRSSLPAHLGTVRPSSLIPSLRRQAMALRLAYSHAIMHANRPFLLATQAHDDAARHSDGECMSAAKTVLETIESMAEDDSLFHAFWWSHYVSFCAMAVVFVWEIQQYRRGAEVSKDDLEMFALAERCHSYLAKATFADSPSRRYALILKELRLEARHESAKNTPADETHDLDVPSQTQGDFTPQYVANEDEEAARLHLAYANTTGGGQDYGAQQFLGDWQTSDWLDLDASAFGALNDLDWQATWWPLHD